MHTQWFLLISLITVISANNQQKYTRLAPICVPGTCYVYVPACVQVQKAKRLCDKLFRSKLIGVNMEVGPTYEREKINTIAMAVGASMFPKFNWATEDWQSPQMLTGDCPIWQVWVRNGDDLGLMYMREGRDSYYAEGISFTNRTTAAFVCETEGLEFSLAWSTMKSDVEGIRRTG